ncbi:MAG: hypothetical protein DSZ29_03260 [Aquificaceae bacterium]|nr:MAG: hypothetical protein DSZ29_03260 [Aquificaceae bacterium]
MAEWRQVAKVCALGDGHISTKEVEILRAVILADGSANKSELAFLQEIKKEAKTAVKALDDLIADCEKVAK